MNKKGYLIFILGLIIIGIIIALITTGTINLSGSKGLRLLNGTLVDTPATAAQMVIVIYWTIDCPYCIEQIEILRHIQIVFDSINAEQQTRVGQVVAINISDSVSKVQEFWAGRYINYPTLVGGKLPQGQRATPVTEVYWQGQLVKTWIGLIDFDTIVTFILEGSGE